MSDEPAPTIVLTKNEELSFQEYFVHRRCEPRVEGFRFEGSGVPAPGVLEALIAADLVIFCPSNPWVSIDPILKMHGVEDALAARPVIAISPIIGGKAVKGPAAKMYAELGITPSSRAVAEHYKGLLDAFVMDCEDEAEAPAIEAQGIPVLVTNTWMHTTADRERLAGEVIENQRINESTNQRVNENQ